MKITYKTLMLNIIEGSMELQSDLFGTTTKWATIVKISESRKRSDIKNLEVTGTPTPAEKAFFNL